MESTFSLSIIIIIIIIIIINLIMIGCRLLQNGSKVSFFQEKSGNFIWLGEQISAFTEDHSYKDRITSAATWFTRRLCNWKAA